jgi:hypothetical protein
VFSAYDGVRYNVWARRYVKDSGWGALSQIEVNNSGTALFANVAVDGNGRATAAWRQFANGDRKDVWVNRFD